LYTIMTDREAAVVGTFVSWPLLNFLPCAYNFSFLSFESVKFCHDQLSHFPFF
jgi:hypothetical protein